MREILFRGKSCIGNWVYGYLKKQMVGDKANVWAIQTEGKEMLHLPATRFKPAKDTLLYENIVTPNTVGQYTGLTDKNGNKIFEGDIVKYKDGMHHWSGAYETPTLVEYECGGFYPFAGEGEYAMSSDYAIVIGNIHDNPELLEAKS